ncbi:hypothetical protein GCK72_020938 [Caenorhabditis remanei]|uniref:Receptor L-domain domain-containing protein n=1 Tax=Caenorhabditis remanei TaxID=31234 RepID=A0A6A5GGM5_CAERE|nr:hypothetical protein GCK72_020938 [Caenorhabditis remanei]KAF1754377.1 hypothetical protein GCK72_020938 [Caenorhabditis remanei]
MLRAILICDIIRTFENVSPRTLIYFFPILFVSCHNNHFRDPKCVFNYTEVTSKTIKFFPKCVTVYGILVINEKTDLTVSQLNVTFSTMTTLIGGIRIENTNLTDLIFLTVDKQDDFFSLYCGKYGIFIENNKYLTNARILWRLYYYGDESGAECTFQVMNNPQLDAENLCDYGYMPLYMDLKVKGNLRDCGCQGDEITESTASSYKNCTKLLRGFRLDNVIIIENLPSFSNVKLIRGGIDIKNSGVHNLSFFESLDTVKVNNEGGGQKLILNLENNPLLERFAMPNLRSDLTIDKVGRGGRILMA